MNRTRLRRLAGPAAIAFPLSFALAACGGSGAAADEGLDGPVRIDGSSTVFPLSNAAAEFYAEVAPGVSVTVGQSGTGGGFEAFCAGRIDISDASRPIGEEERALCEQNGVAFTELTVAQDALTVVVPADFAVDCLTTDQLAAIWTPQSTVDNWIDLDPSFPDQELRLFGPGTDSGTFDYFTEAINGAQGASRSDYQASEDDNVIVEGVANTPGAMGYFGYTYYEENADQLKAVQIDSGSGCVAPSVRTAQDGSYTPLARPLFIYVANESYTGKEQVEGFVDHYIDNLTEIATEARYIPLDEERAAKTRKTLESIGG
ncbi:MAG TPA: PstS family phosphate ABC transporter substrate-binding protein [Nocardioidaceae bacterium]|nr:PstS family phosphate ABC transporter substrate-binding protein [Nocardioidaceae bacterium]